MNPLNTAIDARPWFGRHATISTGFVDPARSDPSPSARASVKRVLYIDDEESIIFLMTRILKHRGFRVSGYTDPVEALAAARANPDQFDLAVTDFKMPRLSGLDVARALKEIRPDLPVVMASGFITDQVRVDALAAGVRAMLDKPFTIDQLCEAVGATA